MSTQLDLVSMFEGLPLDQAKDLAARICKAIKPELEASKPNPNRLVERVEDVYKDFARSRGRG